MLVALWRRYSPHLKKLYIFGNMINRTYFWEIIPFWEKWIYRLRNKSIVDPWTTWGLGIPTILVVENPHKTYVGPLCLWFCRLYNTVVFTIGSNQCCSKVKCSIPDARVAAALIYPMERVWKEWPFFPCSYRGKPWRASIPEFYARVNGTVLEEKQIVCKVQNLETVCRNYPYLWLGATYYRGRFCSE